MVKIRDGSIYAGFSEGRVRIMQLWIYAKYVVNPI